MKVLLVLILAASVVHAQIGFEFYQNDNKHYQSFTSGLEISNNEYLLVGKMYTSADELAMTLMKLDSLGSLTDSIFYLSDEYEITPVDIFENDSSYMVVGRAVAKPFGVVTNIWIGYFSKDLVLMSEVLIPLLASKKYNMFTFYLEVNKKELLFAGVNRWQTGNSVAGKVDLESFELLEKYYSDIGWKMPHILPKADGSGYVISGNALAITDDSFNIVDIYLFGAYPTAPEKFPIGGADIELVNDSTIFWASYFESHLTPFATGAGVMVGTMSYDLDLLNTHILSIYNADSIIGNVETEQRLLAKSSDSTFIVGGYSFLSVSTNSNAIFCAKYNEKAEKIWDVKYDTLGSNFYYVRGVLATSDGGCLLYGLKTESFYSSVWGLYALKIGPSGVVVGETFISGFENLVTIYPNPAKDYIQFDLPKGTDLANLELIDLSGSVVLAQKINHQAPIDISFLPQGMYMYQVKNKMGALMGVGKVLKE